MTTSCKRLALTALLTFGLVGCNLVLGIDDNEIRERDGGCLGSACVVTCSDAGTCASGFRCVLNRCLPDPDANSSDDSGMACDGQSSCDAGPMECTLDGAIVACMCDLADGGCRVITTCADNNGDCPEHADCTDTTSGPSCACQADYIDPTGDQVECVDRCDFANCPATATCARVAGEAQCVCPPNTVRDDLTNRCVVDQACVDLACNANGTNASCVRSNGELICECNGGYEGDGRTCINPNACLPDNPCLNEGRCDDGLGDFKCVCPAGFDGDTCEMDVDDCVDVMCMNGGTCRDGVNAYTCVCATGFNGDACEMNVDDCVGVVCMNGGTCRDGVNTHTCDCAPGFDGDACEMNIDDCVGVVCMNGGTCRDGVNTHTCDCVPGYSGLDCGTRSTDCSTSPCQHGGVCTNVGSSAYSCACGAFYDGNNCQTDVDECATNNGGCGNATYYTCTNNDGAAPTCADIDECATNNGGCGNATYYTCTNRAGNTPTCADINECALNTDNCDANAACTNMSNGFSCTCTAAYYGNGTTCSACTAIANCQSGLTCTSSSNQTCGTCAAGYVGDGTASCTPCGAGTRDSNNACVDCGTIANCNAVETCNAATGSNLTCPTCAAGYRGNGTGTCTACTAIANCSGGLTCTTNNNQTCATCAPGYIGDGTGTCTPCAAGTREINNACVDCGTIENCNSVETCNAANGSNLICPTCATGYSGSGTSSCGGCNAIANCASGLTCTNGSNQTCGTCAAGYIGDGTGACTACGSGTWDNSNACSTCGQISNCSAVETCNVTNGSNSVCPTCAAGYRGNGTGTCTACTGIANCQSGLTCTNGSNQTCGTCAAGYIGDGTGTCTPCGTGTRDSNNACVDCGTINNCSVTETCDAATGGSLTCPTCAAGYRGNGTGSCTACTAIANCASGLTCTSNSNQVCGTCAPGYVGDGTGTCTACGTGTWDNNNTCSTCGQISNCSAVETCNVTNGSNSICPTCAAGYRGNGTGTCTACTAIANCGSGLTCTTNSNQTCANCINGYSGSTCQTPPECTPSTTACVAGSNAYQICDSSWQYSFTVNCSLGDGDTTWEVCRAGACVPSPMVNQVHDEATSWTTNTTLFADEWMVFTLVVPNDMRVFELHAVLGSAPVGASVRMALWEDSGTSVSQPTNRLTWSNLVGVATGDNRITLSASRVVDIVGGRRYWIGINSGSDNVLLRNRMVTSPNGGDYNFWSSIPTTDTTETPPTTFPSGLGGYIRGVRDFGLYVAGKELH